MRIIKFKEPSAFPDNDWYDEWKETAALETDNAKNAYDKNEKYEFKDKIWGKVKKFLFSLSNGRCAYCESFVLDVASGDAEHFRPKKGVTEDPDHKGYYWLAYNLRNLLPSCERCNRAGGKMNHFPLETTITAYCPDDDIKNEEPYLLDPYSEEEKDNPLHHLRFAPPTFKEYKPIFVGTISGYTERGKNTIEICNLKRGGLNTSRAKSQENFFISYLWDMRLPIREIVEKIKNGEEEHSAALYIVFNVVTEMWRKKEEEAKKELGIPEDYFSNDEG